MKIHHSTGSICLKGPLGLIYNVARIDYYLQENDEYEYIFTPNYSVIELLSDDYFQGIPGLNLDLKKEQYIRKNRLPTFISERVPSKSRVDYFELLKEANLEYMEPIEYLINTKLQYFGDPLFVKPYQEKTRVSIKNESSRDNNTILIKKALDNICLGNDVDFLSTIIDDHNRKEIHDIFLSLYTRSTLSRKKEQQKGIAAAKKEGIYRGRKPLPIDLRKFIDLLSEVENKKMTPKEAADQLGISIDKYYREKKKIKFTKISM